MPHDRRSWHGAVRSWHAAALIRLADGNLSNQSLQLTQAGADVLSASNKMQVPATLRIRSTGLAHVDGTGVSTSSMTKSPFCWSGTPVNVVLCSVMLLRGTT